MRFPFSHFIVEGQSMEPTLKKGEHVFTFNWFINLKVGDIVVALVDQRIMIKRLTKVEEKKVFLEGDNKNQSTDSRKFGFIDKAKIIGKVI
jgi:nickel-type superoxide dismutase maturation protease